MAVFRLAYLLTTAFYLAARVTCQTSKSVPDSPCRRFGHQVAVVSDTLYVDGGWTYANQLSITPDKTINRNVLLNNLSQVTVDSPAMPQPYKSFQKSDDVPSVAGGALWADDVNEMIWLYGGEFDVNPKKDFQLWGFDTRSNTWNLSGDSTIVSSDIKRTSYGSGASLPGKGYYYGGYQNSKTTPSWTGSPSANSNLVEFDMQTGRIRGLRAYSDSAGMAEGVMVAIPASAAGMLIYFGGVSYTNANSTEAAMDMSQILVYDIGDNAWFVQTATGDIPGARRKFCAGATVAQDASSYNIYMYGGFGFGANSTGFDDVYILSLPTFTWIKWSSMSYDPKVGNPHGDLTCTVVGSNQMIVMGGNFTAAPADYCDVPKQYNQHNLILGSQNENENGWNPYSPTRRQSKYYVPRLITNITGGSPIGGATNVKPARWSNDNLAKYFSQTATFAHRTPTRAAAAGTAGSKSHVGAIAGGVAGGCVALIIIVVLVWWFCIRGRKSRSNRRLGHGRPQQPIRSEMNADPHRYSKQPSTFSTAADSNFYLQGQQAHPGASPPMDPHHHPSYSQIQQWPSQMQSEGYGSWSSYHYQQPQHHPSIGGELPNSVFLHRPNAQNYNYPPPETQSMPPSRPHELDANGTPRSYNTQHFSFQAGHYAGIESISDKAVGNIKSDTTSQSTQSPVNPTWKG